MFGKLKWTKSAQLMPRNSVIEIFWKDNFNSDIITSIPNQEKKGFSKKIQNTKKHSIYKSLTLLVQIFFADFF